MSLSEYISEYPTLLPTAIIVCAAFLVVLVAAFVIKTIFEKEKQKKSALADIVLSDEDEPCEYKITETEQGFVASLVSGEEKLCETEPYSSLAGVKSAAKSLKMNIENGNFTLKQNGDGGFTVKLYSSSKTLFESTPFDSEEEAKEFIEHIKACSLKASI